jgi:hypothetical protein
MPAFMATYISGTGYVLQWQPSPDADLQYYKVYRGSRPDFQVLAGDQPVHQTTETQWTDSPPTASYYKLSAVDFAGNQSEPRAAGTSTDTADERPPGRFVLHQNTPNPFNPRTIIRYELPVGGRVQLRVYDIRGRLVRTLVDRQEGTGHKIVAWDGLDDQHRQVSGGIYLYRLTGPGCTETLRMALIR